MNHSIHSADRATHLKIVVVALVAGIAVAAFGIAARTNVDYSQTAQTAHGNRGFFGDWNPDRNPAPLVLGGVCRRLCWASSTRRPAKPARTRARQREHQQAP